MARLRCSLSRCTALVLLGLGALCGGQALSVRIAPGQDTPPPQEAAGQQRAAGHEVYLRDCARCHGPLGGKGETAPSLISPEMAQKLPTFQTASALFIFMRFAMPQDKPGSLPEEDYWAVLAFVLASNGLIQDSTLLRPDTADGVTLQR